MATVTGVGWPIDLVTYGHVSSCIVMLSPNHGMVPDGYAQASPIIHQQLGASPLMETCPDCRS